MADLARVFDSKDELTHALAERIVELARVKVETSGRFTIALSGGSTPRPLYESFVSSAYVNQIPWQSTFFFFGDERCVPHDSQDSNYHMVKDAMLSRFAVPAENVYPTQMQDIDPLKSAALYEETIKKFFKLEEGQFPRFDLILLGLGPDGHTASLFPGTKALEERRRIVVANYVEKLATHRITLTFPAINNAENIFFVVAGRDKASVVAEILADKSAENGLTIKYPAQLIKPESGNIKWYLDREAYAESDSASFCR